MTELSIERIDWCHEKGVLGTFTFDRFYASAEMLNPIAGLNNADGTHHGYVADLKFHRKVVFKGVEQQVVECAKTIPPKDRKQVVSSDGTKQWCLSVCVTMLHVRRKVRIVILWRYKNDAAPRKILVTNRIFWNAERIVETYRGRGTGTGSVPLHRSWLMLTSFDSPWQAARPKGGEATAMQRATLPYRLWMRERDQTRVSGWTSVKQTTIGEGGRAMLRESVSTMIGWVIDRLDSTAKHGRNTAQILRNILRRIGRAPAQ
jgi:hypothetical protein